MNIILILRWMAFSVIFASVNALAVDQGDPINATVEIFADTGQYVQVGSGFFISPHGDIATAYHVIVGAKNLQIISHQGSFSQFSIKAFDPAKDLAIISVQPLGPIKFIPVKAPPDSLLGKSGLVLGNPDLKKDFSVHVTFPRNQPLLSREWSVATQAAGARWIFAKGDIKLIALDGTLNHGMSGGPVIVDGSAIGVFSGGEQQSGGGLGWAISAEYLGTLTPAPAGTLTSTLPPLSLLSPNSEKPVLLKAVQTPSGKALFPSLMNMNAARSNLQGYIIKTNDIRDGLEECQSYLRSISDGRINHPPADGTKEQACLALPFIATQLFYSAMQSSEDLSHQIGLFGSPNIGTLMQNRLLSIGTVDVKQGFFRSVAETATACEIKDRLSSAQKIFDVEAGKLKVVGVLAEHVPQFPTSEMTNSNSGAALSNQVFAYLQHDYGIILINVLIALYQELPPFLNATYSISDPVTDCLEASMRAIDFQADMTRRDESVATDQLTPPEDGYFLGIFVGYYDSTIAIANECRSRYGNSDRIDEGIFQFKQKHLLYLQHADEIGARVAGKSDYDDLKQTGLQQAALGATRIMNGIDSKGVGAAFCKSIASHLPEKDIALDSPDTAEAISGAPVDRSKAQNQSVRLLLQHSLGNAFASAFRRNFNQASDLLPSLLPDLFRAMALSWESNLIVQCSDIASPLPPETSRFLSSLAENNQTAAIRTRDSVSKKIIAAGGSASDMQAFWKDMDIEANEMNDTFMRQFGIQTSNSLAGACVNLTHSDVQQQIAKFLDPSGEELAQLLAK